MNETRWALAWAWSRCRLASRHLRAAMPMLTIRATPSTPARETDARWRRMNLRVI